MVVERGCQGSRVDGVHDGHSFFHWEEVPGRELEVRVSVGQLEEADAVDGWGAKYS